MYTTCSDLVVFMYRTGKSMNNLLSYCGLVDSRISTSDKDLPVQLLYCTFLIAEFVATSPLPGISASKME